MPLLGVNIDHVATVRQARQTDEPDPVWAAALCELGGADSIVVHLREDRRHIQERDVRLLKETVSTRLNLEMSIAPSIVALALKHKPDQATFVPEKRQELTTEGGLDVIRFFRSIRQAVSRLRGAHINVSLFVDPESPQIEKAKETGCLAVELHTGSYAQAKTAQQRTRQLQKLKKAIACGTALGLTVHAGHGLTYRNVGAVAQLGGLHELNIGHSVVSRAILVGLERAVREMKHLVCVEQR
ncbi:MAG: pyridoxine 5'-phosphate synthase [Candidatus Omnitrophica bacterium]|nr:pyridoxine 5'-phosphate synthase [Candidatus Omnitrophota bacterium]